jgi:hypothetical protein
MNISVISILAGWIVFSTLLVTLILVNSARLSHSDSQEIGPGQPTGELRKKRFELATLIKNLIQ